MTLSSEDRRCHVRGDKIDIVTSKEIMRHCRVMGITDTSLWKGDKADVLTLEGMGRQAVSL